MTLRQFRRKRTTAQGALTRSALWIPTPSGAGFDLVKVRPDHLPPRADYRGQTYVVIEVPSLEGQSLDEGRG